MGDHTSSRTNKIKKKNMDDTTTSSSSPSRSPSTSDDDSKTPQKRHKLHHRRHSEDRRRSDSSSRREKDEKSRKKRKRSGKERERKHRSRRRDDKRRSRREQKRLVSESDDGSESSGDDNSEPRRSRMEPQAVLGDMLKAFPNVANDLKQLLQMIDDGQAVDIRGISERSLIKHLKKLFVSLNLKENDGSAFLLPSNIRPTLEVLGPMIFSHIEPKEQELDHYVSLKDTRSETMDAEHEQVVDTNNLAMPCPADDASAPRRRMIGPEMPSAELLAAAAKLTEAEAELREAELDGDDEIFIGPPPPSVVSEAESANEAERFEEVTRIMGVEADSPYDVLGVNRNMSVDNMKKRYWKLSLMVHPDKCSHPQAHQAFIILNKAFKDLQDPDKRKALDDKIKLKEEQEEFKAELQAMREAAQWRRLQGISMEGDDELLADINTKAAPQREEWMTTLPPERKPGMTMQSTKFSRTSREGRGDTSMWTDTPLDKAQKAKTNYLEAYNEAAALASNEEEKKRTGSDADLVDKFNKAKRSKSLVQKHQEEAVSRSKKKSKKQSEKEEWVGQHPWKPWDRETDLTAGRQSVKLDSENMVQGLSSRFSSGNFQRNFL